MRWKASNPAIFVIDGKLVSVEVENFEPIAEDDSELDLAQEIEDYPELKASLQKIFG